MDYGIDLDNTSIEEIKSKTRALEHGIHVMTSDMKNLRYESLGFNERIREAQERIKLNKQLPYMVTTVKEAIKENQEEEEEGSITYSNLQNQGPGVIIQTSTRQVIYLTSTGLVSPSSIKPGNQLGVNKDNFAIFEELPIGYDVRAQAMEVIEKPIETYSDIGGLDNQIQELLEAVVLPITCADKFKKIGIKPPRGVLMYGPPGTGKTLLARACAAKSGSTFFKLAGPQLIQKFVGDGAKIVRHAFELAREKSPSIIFIDEIDAIGTKRRDDSKNSDREVQRTMLELLNQLDGFSSDDKIKVIAATNRVDTLDPALLRSGRLDKKIEFPTPNEEARAKIIQIHSKKLKISPDINYQELARSCPDFNGAQCKAVCVEAGMIALRRNGEEITHEDFIEGIYEVQSKKKSTLNYYT